MRSRKIQIKIIAWVTLIIAGVCSMFVFTPRQDAFAETATISTANVAILKKTLAQGIYNCYRKGAVQGERDPILEKYNNATGFLSDKASSINVVLISGLGSGNPLKMGKYNIAESVLSCKKFIAGDNQLFSGKNVNDNIFAVNGITPPQATSGDITKIGDFLTKMGYEVTGISKTGDNNCVAVKYGFAFGSTINYTNQLCNNNGTPVINRGAEETRRTLDFVINADRQVCLSIIDGNAHLDLKCESFNGNNFGVDWVNGLINGANCTNNICTRGDYTIKLIGAENQSNISSASARINNYGRAGLQAASFLLGDTYYSEEDVKLNNVYRRMLYQDYLTNYYRATVNCPAESGQKQISWFNTNEIQNCSYSTTNAKNIDNAVNDITDGGWMSRDGIKGLDQLISKFSSLSTNYNEGQLAEMVAIQAAGGYNSNSGSGLTSTSDISKECEKNAGLDGISWIVCPAIANSASAADGFSSMIDGMLTTKSSLYDSNSKAYKVWQTVRDLANIIIILILIVVIFSQLTGFGIDNYGIKKILPRLIVMAILINLSFVLCELAIDLSNIFGSGLNDLFRNVAGGDTSNTGTFIVTIVGSLLAAGGAVAGIGAVATVAAAPMVAISLVLSLLTALVGVLIFFLTLGAREIIIVVFMALAPVAFACYILPNTQSIFKKWWKVFEAALVVYPICGALYGMSFIIRSMFGSPLNAPNVEFWEAIIALIAPFLPFFVMPSLLKGALSGLGVAGGAIAALGNGIRRGIGRANKTVRGTEGYRAGVESMDTARRRITNAWRVGEGPRGIRNTFRTFRNNTRSMRGARAQSAYQKDLEAGTREAKLNDPKYIAELNRKREASLSSEREKDYMEGLAMESERKNIEENLRNSSSRDSGYDAEYHSANFRTLIDRGGTKEALQYAMSAEGDINNMDEDRRSYMLRNMATSNIDAFKAFAKYRQKGGHRNFADWFSGAGMTRNASGDLEEIYTGNDGQQYTVTMADQYMSYAGHWGYRGAEHTTTLSKDEMEFLDDNLGSVVGNGNGKVSNGMLAASLMRTAVYSKDVGSQNRAEKMLREGLMGGKFGISDLKINAQMLGDMKRHQTIEAVRDGVAERAIREDARAKLGQSADSTQIENYVARYMGNDDSAVMMRNGILQTQMADTIQAAKKYNKIWTGMQNDVRDIIDSPNAGSNSNTNGGGSQDSTGGAAAQPAQPRAGQQPTRGAQNSQTGPRQQPTPVPAPQQPAPQQPAPRPTRASQPIGRPVGNFMNQSGQRMNIWQLPNGRYVDENNSPVESSDIIWNSRRRPTNNP